MFFYLSQCFCIARKNTRTLNMKPRWFVEQAPDHCVILRSEYWKSAYYSHFTVNIVFSNWMYRSNQKCSLFDKLTKSEHSVNTVTRKFFYLISSYFIVWWLEGLGKVDTDKSQLEVSKNITNESGYIFPYVSDLYIYTQSIITYLHG